MSSSDDRRRILEADATCPASTAASLAPGDIVGSWRVESLRANGGFAAVYRASHVETGAPAALKVLHHQLVGDRQSLLRFQQEISAIDRLDHPHIVKVLDTGALAEQQPYFAMEWLVGDTIDEELAHRGRYSVAEAAALGAQLCSALAAVHALGFVHRDLKPANVIVTRTGDTADTKLVDFGIAKLFDPHSDDGAPPIVTSEGVCIGTPHYMAPEQILGLVGTAAIDVYALGVLLFRMLTGRFPFEADSAPELHELHLHAPTPRVSGLTPVPEALEALVARCMHKHSSMRYPNAAAVQEALLCLDRPASAGLVADTSAAVGMYVEASAIAGAALSDDQLDAVDDRLLRDQERLEQYGFELALDTATSFLMVLPLPFDDTASQEARRAAVRAALELRTLELADSHGVTVSITLHEAEVQADPRAEPFHYIGGALLDVGHWARVGHEGAVVATAAAVQPFADELEAVPLDDGYVAIRRLRP